MARIADHDLERLKAEVDVTELAKAAGVRLRRHGRTLVGLCPFHKDSNPSLSIDPDKNLWHCFGACLTGGSVIDWVMRVERIDFSSALAWLAERHLVRSSPGGRTRRWRVRPARPAREPVQAITTREEKLLGRVCDEYHHTLQHNRSAQDYLKGRGLWDPELVATMRLGFSDGSLNPLHPDTPRRLRTLGVVRADGREHFTGCIVVPIFGSSGVVEMYGRRIDPFESGRKHLYLPGAHSGVWNHAGLHGSREIILCEALMDAMTFWVAGRRNVTSAYGVNGFTRDHERALRQGNVKRVFIAFDADEAGDRGAQRLAIRLAGHGIASARVKFPRGTDANSFAQEETPPGKNLEAVLDSAVPLCSIEGP